MDLDEWELLSDDDGFLLDFQDGDYGGKKRNSRPNSVFKMDYFSPPKFIKPIKIPNSPDPIELNQIQPDPSKEKVVLDDDNFLEKIKAPVLLVNEVGDGGLENDQEKENLPQVFFKKMKEKEFVDMKLIDSPPRSNNSKVVMLQIESGKFQFNEATDTKPVSPKGMKNNNKMELESEKEDEVNHDGLKNIWRWSLTGVGAICSIGFAAATICIVVFGNSQRIKQQKTNQKMRFQIYADDKSIKQVVDQANRLNDAISAVRGVPLTRAHITYGGYYDAL